MRAGIAAIVLALSAATPSLAGEAPEHVMDDPPRNAENPAGMEALVLPVGDGAMNAVLYTAAGEGPHPTLLLLHGFPGNEQNLDLAQAARRAGWNVLTLHYRGSWGSPGHFSFGRAAEDARAALAYLRSPGVAARYRIERETVAVAGHSMGGFMAAEAAAADPSVVGLALIDAWDIGGFARTLEDPEAMRRWRVEVAHDLPPLSGTSEEALTAEMTENPDRFDITRRVAAFGDRPLDILGARLGIGGDIQPLSAAARRAGNTQVTEDVWETDHGFADRRIALAQRLVAWLETLR
ncbi:alpha/beta hydrolase family protein [Altericroceibacterium xinjiangense]|uniref:alpha/beta hydrolase family protein n=1 Tax=Altericroceibacterium xinjiangense TaxID=762261 RepID=UPI000F7F3DCB|nr:alpha/beta hydrolase [Altericroceibacterium xinjiangense]